MSITTIPPTGNPPLFPEIPPLENGDHLSREEFERRYLAMPHLKKAELIEGVVHMPSPVRVQRHGDPHADLVTWLGHYRAMTPGVRVSDNSTVRLDQENEVQPDVHLRIETNLGGQAHITSDDYIEGGPELLSEVSASSASIDLNTKFRVYQRNGVREYIVWRVRDRAIGWFVLRHSQFERLSPNAAGILQSEVFPGLWLDVQAVLRGDLATVLAVLQKGITDPAHADFLAKLRK
jgi:Uma2 family endonuclease